jgi:catechol 2,3-dioxygenase-like lactoylglutathione lyase family enzyme
LPKPVLVGVEPQLFVSSLDASFAYYTEKLGFDVAFSYGDPPFYGQVARDGVKLNLRQVEGPVFDARLRENEGLLSASITLDDAGALFLEYQATGVHFAQTLKTEPWGARTFIVSDPDGNLILFAS